MKKCVNSTTENKLTKKVHWLVVAFGLFLFVLLWTFIIKRLGWIDGVNLITITDHHDNLESLFVIWTWSIFLTFILSWLEVTLLMGAAISTPKNRLISFSIIFSYPLFFFLLFTINIPLDFLFFKELILIGEIITLFTIIGLVYVVLQRINWSFLSFNPTKIWIFALILSIIYSYIHISNLLSLHGYTTDVRAGLAYAPLGLAIIVLGRSYGFRLALGFTFFINFLTASFLVAFSLLK